jgi:TRAP transporter TAXI family solute receptor
MKGGDFMLRKKFYLKSGIFYIIFAIAFIYLSSASIAQIKSKEQFQLEISTLPTGFASYLIGVGLADLINKKSNFIKATHIEGRSPVVHMRTLITKPEKRKSYLFFNTTWDIWEAKKQLGPFEKVPFKYEEFRFIFLMGVAGNGLCTLDQNIKTLKDMVGKRVIFDSTPGGGREIVYKGILNELGIPVDKLKYQYASGETAGAALRDGMADVIYSGSALKRLPHFHVASPFTAELVATKNVYFISFEEKAIKSFKSKTGHPVDFQVLPPKILGPLQTEPYTILLKPLGFCAHQDMPEDVVQEILNIVYENAHLLKEYTPMAEIINKESLASLGIPEGDYHSAAQKFFKQKGIKIKGLGF